MRNKNKPNPFKLVNELKTKLAFKEQDHNRVLKKMRRVARFWQILAIAQLLYILFKVS
jgi:hypothetical protein